MHTKNCYCLNFALSDLAKLVIPMARHALSQYFSGSSNHLLASFAIGFKSRYRDSHFHLGHLRHLLLRYDQLMHLFENLSSSLESMRV